MDTKSGQSVFGRKSNEIPAHYNGNIDLNNRKVYVPPSREYIQTEESMSFDPNENDPELRGKYNVAIPKVVDGKLLETDGEAIQSFFKVNLMLIFMAELMHKIWLLTTDKINITTTVKAG